MLTILRTALGDVLYIIQEPLQRLTKQLRLWLSAYFLFKKTRKIKCFLDISLVNLAWMAIFYWASIRCIIRIRVLLRNRLDLTKPKLSMTVPYRH